MKLYEASKRKRENIIVKCAVAPEAKMQPPNATPVQGCRTKFAWHQTLLKAGLNVHFPKRHASPVSHEARRHKLNFGGEVTQTWIKHSCVRSNKLWEISAGFTPSLLSVMQQDGDFCSAYFSFGGSHAISKSQTTFCCPDFPSFSVKWYLITQCMRLIWRALNAALCCALAANWR